MRVKRGKKEEGQDVGTDVTALGGDALRAFNKSKSL